MPRMLERKRWLIWLLLRQKLPQILLRKKKKHVKELQSHWKEWMLKLLELRLNKLLMQKSMQQMLQLPRPKWKRKVQINFKLIKIESLSKKRLLKSRKTILKNKRSKLPKILILLKKSNKASRKSKNNRKRRVMTLRKKLKLFWPRNWRLRKTKAKDKKLKQRLTKKPLMRQSEKKSRKSRKRSLKRRNKF